MNTKLKHVQNLPELARQANWSAAQLAKMCGVSRRTLARSFKKQFAKSPKIWITEQRQKQAVKLLRDGFCVKETAAELGYNCAHNFSRDFKKHWGYCPTKDQRPNV